MLDLKKFFCGVAAVTFVAGSAFALDLHAVFDNQKKAAFPDTCEIRMRTTVTLPGGTSEIVETTVIQAGKSKSVTTVKSRAMQMKIVQKDGRMKVSDLKTGKSLPASNMPVQNPADMNRQMGNPADYNPPVAEDSLWKITPKDASKPTLYYSQRKKRVVKMNIIVDGAESVSEFEYAKNSDALPGTLKKVTIVTKSSTGESNVVLEVLKARPRHVLPGKMFNLDDK